MTKRGWGVGTSWFIVRTGTKGSVTVKAFDTLSEPIPRYKEHADHVERIVHPFSFRNPFTVF
jgi:hypothetical protein